jgi:hypothetical protein
MQRVATIALTAGLVVAGCSVASDDQTAPLLLTAESRASTRTFFSPSLDGKRIAFCLQSAERCGKPVADVWCQSQGFAEALLFQRDEPVEIKPVYVNTGLPCTEPACVTFQQIKCRTN